MRWVYIRMKLLCREKTQISFGKDADAVKWCTRSIPLECSANVTEAPRLKLSTHVTLHSHLHFAFSSAQRLVNIFAKKLSRQCGIARVAGNNLRIYIRLINCEELRVLLRANLRRELVLLEYRTRLHSIFRQISQAS